MRLFAILLIALIGFAGKIVAAPFISLDFLYWQARANGLGYAAISDSPTFLKNAKILAPHFEWDEGFRIGIGTPLSHDCWQLSLEWTRFHTFARKNTHTNPQHYLFPTWTTPTIAPQGAFHAAEEHWRLHLGIVDLALARTIDLSAHLQLIPHLALRYGCFRQKYHLHYSQDMFPPSETLALSMKNKFWGIGVDGGGKVLWNLGRDFYIFGKGNLSILYGHFYVHQAEMNEENEERLLGLHSLFSLSTPLLQFAGGIEWQKDFEQSCYHLEIALGWEELMLFHQNQFLHFTTASSPGTFFSNQGDITLQGITLHTRFCF